MIRLWLMTLGLAALTCADLCGPDANGQDVLVANTSSSSCAQREAQCACGPDGIFSPSCAVLLHRAASEYVNGRLIIYVRGGSRVQRHAFDCLEAKDVKKSTRLFWPRQNEASPIDIRAFEPGDLRCERQGWKPQVLWHIARVYHYTPYHFLFDHGVLQAFMMDKAFRRLVANLPRYVFHLVDDIERRNRSTETRLPVHAYLEAAVPHDDYRYRQDGELLCHEWTTFGYWFASPMQYSGTWLLEPALRDAIQSLSTQVTTHFTAGYGDREPIPSAILVNDEPPSDDYDRQNRSRGVQPALKELFLSRIKGAIGPVTVRHAMFNEGVPLKTQWETIRQHRLIISAEGGFFTHMLISPPGATWIMIYNHSRPREAWRHSNFHASVASALPVRLLIFVVASGKVSDLSGLINEAARPWRSGVFYFGADAKGFPTQ